MNSTVLDTVMRLTRRVREMQQAMKDADEMTEALQVHGDLHSTRQPPAVRVACTLQVVNCLDPINKPTTTMQFTLPPGIAWTLLYSLVFDMHKYAEDKLSGLVEELEKYIKE